MESAVAYYRVSTKQQQRSGLDIEAQRATGSAGRPLTAFMESAGDVMKWLSLPTCRPPASNGLNG